MLKEKQSEMFFVLAVAQALIRNKYEVSTEERIGSRFRADLLARKGGEMFIVEVKTVEGPSDVDAAAATVRRQLRGVAETIAYVAIGVKGTNNVYLDKGLNNRLMYPSSDLKVKSLKPA